MRSLSDDELLFSTRKFRITKLKLQELYPTGNTFILLVLAMLSLCKPVFNLRNLKIILRFFIPISGPQIPAEVKGWDIPPYRTLLSRADEKPKRRILAFMDVALQLLKVLTTEVAVTNYCRAYEGSTGVLGVTA